MSKYLVLLYIGCLIFISSCDEKKAVSTLKATNWEQNILANSLPDSLVNGSTYLSIYSQIYSENEHLTHDLTATVSIRNTSKTDTIFITNADYFNTKGTFVRNYIDKNIYLKPLETLAIVIHEKDKEGGTGANFIFDWKTKKNTSEPLFEGIMISTSGSQGLSFSTQGKRVQ